MLAPPFSSEWIGAAADPAGYLLNALTGVVVDRPCCRAGRLKDTYDPTNLFRLNQNIQPSRELNGCNTVSGFGRSVTRTQVCSRHTGRYWKP
jgi:Berberine and berberine like